MIQDNMIITGIIFSFVLGTLFASFLNVCIDRLPAKQSLLFPPSHCSSCNHRLAIRDLIPVFSYLCLKGRCRYCQAKLPLRLLLVETGTGLLFAFLFWHYGLSVEFALTLLFSSVFIVLSIIDLDHQLILNIIIYPATLIALVVSIFIAPSRLLSAGGTILTMPDFLPRAGIAQAAIGMGIGLVLFTLIIIVSRGGMGWGDAKMAGLVGAITGYLIPLAIFLAVIIGGLLAIILLVFKLKKRKEGIPFGPFLALGAMLTILWGNDIAGWYLAK
jgi:leader peptidase (prepilin peptidase)/N-methyltransferase